MNSEALIFDLDDTLTNTKIRHYKVVADYVQSCGHAFLNFGDYLRMRQKEKLSNLELLKRYFPDTINNFQTFWLEHIETMPYLQYDVEIVSPKLLAEVKEKRQCTLLLLSLRSRTESAETQFQNFSFATLFDKVFFVQHHLANPKISVLKELKSQYSKIYFFGDAESDVTAAEKAGIMFYGVDTGLYNLHVPNKEATINHALLNFLP